MPVIVVAQSVFDFLIKIALVHRIRYRARWFFATNVLHLRYQNELGVWFEPVAFSSKLSECCTSVTFATFPTILLKLRVCCSRSNAIACCRNNVAQTIQGCWQFVVITNNYYVFDRRMSNSNNASPSRIPKPSWLRQSKRTPKIQRHQSLVSVDYRCFNNNENLSQRVL